MVVEGHDGLCYGVETQRRRGVRSLFYDTFGTYTFATGDESPTTEDALLILRGIAQSPEAMERLRQRAEELDLTPVLHELSDEEVLRLYAQNVASGAFRFWEAPALAPPGVDTSHARPAAPAPRAEPAPKPAEPAARPAPSSQAAALREAAARGAPFCEI